jgi:probable F420-dependent oxidoreductase
MRSALGLSLPLDGVGLAACVELAQRAETLGYTDVWTSEIGGADGFSLLGAIAARTDSLRLGTGVIPVYTRPPALIAMSAAALQALSSGRFCLGLGSSTEIVVDRWMGLAADRPLQRVRETVHVVREVLSGGRVSFEGETLHVRDFRLQLTRSGLQPVPIVLGALGPRMLNLAAEVADGVFLSHTGLAAVPRVVQAFDAARRSAGRSNGDVIQRIGVAMDEDEELLREVFRRELAAYGRTKAYNASFAAQGFDVEAAEIRAAWDAGEPEVASAAVSDDMLEDLYVFGTPDVCRQRLNAFRTAGIRTPIIIPISIADDPEQRRERRLRVLVELAR